MLCSAALSGLGRGGAPQTASGTRIVAYSVAGLARRPKPPSPKHDDMAELDGFLEDDGATVKPPGPAVVAPSPPRAAPVAPPPAASPKQVVAVPVKTFDPFAM